MGRVKGSIRRLQIDLLDHIIPLNEEHRKRQSNPTLADIEALLPGAVKDEEHQ
jgi:hypothetical protein